MRSGGERLGLAGHALPREVRLSNGGFLRHGHCVPDPPTFSRWGKECRDHPIRNNAETAVPLFKLPPHSTGRDRTFDYHGRTWVFHIHGKKPYVQLLVQAFHDGMPP
jgi:hypothetical protein